MVVSDFLVNLVVHVYYLCVYAIQVNWEEHSCILHICIWVIASLGNGLLLGHIYTEFFFFEIWLIIVIILTVVVNI